MRYSIVAAAIVSALFLRAFFISVYKVPTQTMAPNIVSGDFILAFQNAYGFKVPWGKEIYFSSIPDRGDLVAFTKDSRIYIKRVIAIPGDEIEVVGDDNIINSEPCKYELVGLTANDSFQYANETCGSTERSIIRSVLKDKVLNVAKKKLGPSDIFVAGDFRYPQGSSEYAETISADQIISKPALIWMSYASTQDFISKDTGIRWNRILTKLR